MIEVQVPKDVSGYEAPLIGPLTAKQTICVAVAAVVEYAYYYIVSNIGLNIKMESMVGIGVLLALPILYIAMAHPYGMKAEDYLYYFFIPSLIGNKDRPYETTLSYDVMLEAIEAMEAEENEKNGKKNTKKNEPKKKNKNTKKVSKQDIRYA